MVFKISGNIPFSERRVFQTEYVCVSVCLRDRNSAVFFNAVLCGALPTWRCAVRHALVPKLFTLRCTARLKSCAVLCGAWRRVRCIVPCWATRNFGCES
jgi:hypothetical protein